MPYLFYCHDSPQADSKRQATLHAHLQYIESIADQLLVAGPLRESAESSPTGSCLVYRTDNREEALRLLQEDPYFTAGVWSSWSCQYFNAVAGEWVGGIAWQAVQQARD